MARRYRVTLTQEERELLRHMVSRGKADASKLAHACILLQADESEGGPRQTDEQIASALETSTRTAGERTGDRRRESCGAAGRQRGPLPPTPPVAAEAGVRRLAVVISRRVAAGHPVEEHRHRGYDHGGDDPGNEQCGHWPRS